MFKIEKRINGIGKWLPVETGPLGSREDAEKAMSEAADAELDKHSAPWHDFYNVRFRVVLAAIACFAALQ